VSGSKIRIYVEGGGDGSSGKAAIRRGLNTFLEPLRELVRAKRIRWNLTACGSRESAYDLFCTALRTHQDAFVVLLVDAESRPVDPTSPWKHLKTQDGWDCPEQATEDSAQLMVQAMEAWIVADPDAVKAYYGNKFNERKLPNIKSIESVSPSQLESGLKDAAGPTQKKTYHKIRDAEGLLKCISLETVRLNSPSCQRLCDVIEQFAHNS